MITNAELGTEAKRFTIEQGFEPNARIPAQKAYIAGFTYCRELLHKHDVGGRSEQLVCDCQIPKPIDPYDEVDKHECSDCGRMIAN